MMIQNDLLSACHQDLERLIPYWLSHSDLEREWHVQRWVDKVSKQPEVYQAFKGALKQNLVLWEAGPETERDEAYHFSRALLFSLI